MHYDTVIIGAGMSGLAAGIRLAYFDKRVCIVEKHHAYGGLNSYYTLDGHELDVGLHAVTNFSNPQDRTTPLAQLFRQLRIRREEFDLRAQKYSEIRFPDARLRFTNSIDVLTKGVERLFPRDTENFRRLINRISDFNATRLDQTYQSARSVLAGSLSDPKLIEMILCPMQFYGSAQEGDMDFSQFVTMFKSIFCEGMARPRGGVRTIIKVLVKKFRSCGGRLKMGCGVKRIHVEDGRVKHLTLESGETLTADVVLSCAGYFETMRLCSDGNASRPEGTVGQLSFVECIAILDTPPARLGHNATIVFFNNEETFTYARPDQLVDLRSGILCCPNNYEGHEGLTEGILRLTWLADYRRWADLDDDAYAAAKAHYYEEFLDVGSEYMPDLRDHVVFRDMFTPRTITHYTGRINGAVYGAPRKRRDGRTRLKNLFVCGTDQGFLGIIGAMLSGITIANLHVLSES